MTDINLAIQRANQAKELLENPLYIEAVAVMQASMFAEFESSKLDDTDKRHELWQRMQLMKHFRGHFEAIVREGKRAEDTIKLTV